MDPRSHEIFTRVLLESVGRNSAYSQWGNSPDLDFDILLHRYWRHRLTVLPEIYQEFSAKYPSIPAIDKDNIVLGIVSHLYSDTFNGFVVPFYIQNPLFQIPKMFAELIKNPYGNILKLSEPDIMPDSFFTESEALFKQYNFGSTVEQVVMTFLDLIAKRTKTPICFAREYVVSFTGNTNYTMTLPVDISTFENAYSEHIISYL
jgi:hypothetical protein